jgi:hypothetical protein
MISIYWVCEKIENCRKKYTLFHSSFLAHSSDAFVKKMCSVSSESPSQRALSAAATNCENAATAVLDYFRLGLAQLGRIGVIAWGTEIIRLDVGSGRSGNGRKH